MVDQETKYLLKDIYKKCDIYYKYTRLKMKPIVDFNLVNNFNQVIALDLHELGLGLWYLHMIDLFSRLRLTVVIRSKEAGVIVDKFTQNWIAIYHHHHHHHVVPLARISLTLSRHPSLSFIASGRSSGLHPVSSHSCCMYVRAGRPAFAWPYAGVHRSTSLMSSSLLLQQCPACLARLTCIVFVMGGKWPYSWCLVGCCRQDLVHLKLVFF